jgi:hypothetical protein
VLLNEILASNTRVNRDFQGHYDDWIELYNPGSTAVNLAGMYLTNDWKDPTRWQIPADRPAFSTLQPRGYLLIWADGDTDASLGLHAPFRLDADGEQLALYATDGKTLLDRVEFGPQVPDVSYGRDTAAGNEWRFQVLATPAAANIASYLGAVADLQFNYERGFYSQPLSVEITTTTPGASIFYTVDGSSPFNYARGAMTGRPYTGPIPITATTSLRAIATKTGWLPTRVATHTYFFLNDIITQATNPQTRAQAVPAGYPTSWGSVTGDYQMDPDVVGQNGTDLFGGLYARTIKDDLKAVPTICLVMDKNDWFGSLGIYINQSQDGTERVASFEFLDPARAQAIQVNGAIAMQGGVSGGGTSLDRWKTWKLSMRPRFKTQTDDGTPTGGPTKLDFKLFRDSPVDRYNTVVLDAVLNHGWLHPGADQQVTAMYVQDQYVGDLHNALGGHSGHGFYAHVYLNTLYWGMYYIHERPDHAWAAQVFGGDESEYDALKHNSGDVINHGTGGNATTNYNAMVNAAGAVGSDPTSAAKYQALCNLLDVDNFITYLLATYYTGNHDWPHKNWYATHRNVPGSKWRFHSWDSEHTLEGDNQVGRSPSDLHAKLAQNAEYRLRFADHVRRTMFHDGPLTPAKAAALFKARMSEIDRAIVGESARWGDNRRSQPYTRQDWLSTMNAKLTGFFPGRTNQVLGWLKSANLYPSVEAPEFLVNGVAQHGGSTAVRAALSMTGPGTIWYTLDGTDPRVLGTAPATNQPTALVPESAARRVLVPTGPVNDAWRTDPAFNDSAWLSGTGGVGYERNSGYENLVRINLQSLMYGKNTTCYIRIPFTVTAATLTGLTSLKLNVRYDDGFIAYLNGAEVQRAQFTGTPAWNSAASADHPDAAAQELETFDISARIGSLHAGANLLAIHALNGDLLSSDFLLSVELSASRGPAGGTADSVSPTAVRYTAPVLLAQSTWVKARTLSGSTWSALNEAVFAVGPVAQSLRVSEIMYHPLDTGNPDDPNCEFIELTNIAGQSINLNLVRFTKGIDFTFPSFDLPPGGYCLVVKDSAAFRARYGAALPVVGAYTGSLDNSGERLELVDAVGQVIESFVYDDWYANTDGRGYSLTVKNPAGPDLADLNEEEAWRPSASPGGSPGRL